MNKRIKGAKLWPAKKEPKRSRGIKQIRQRNAGNVVVKSPVHTKHGTSALDFVQNALKHMTESAKTCPDTSDGKKVFKSIQLSRP